VTTMEPNARPARTHAPKVDILETEAGLRLWADLPGVDERSLEVELVDGMLAIRGHVPSEESENLTPLHTEYGVGNFDARFRLSSAIDGDGIRATLRNGVLQLELPKVESAKPRKIEVG
jgi:HSP20 family protein